MTKSGKVSKKMSCDTGNVTWTHALTPNTPDLHLVSQTETHHNFWSHESRASNFKLLSAVILPPTKFEILKNAVFRTHMHI